VGSARRNSEEALFFEGLLLRGHNRMLQFTEDPLGRREVETHTIEIRRRPDLTQLENRVPLRRSAVIRANQFQPPSHHNPPEKGPECVFASMSFPEAPPGLNCSPSLWARRLREGLAEPEGR
jgi:hypothetical protein